MFFYLFYFYFLERLKVVLRLKVGFQWFLECFSSEMGVEK